MPDLLGYQAPFTLDLIIIASIVLLIPAIVMGVVWAKRKEYRKHAVAMAAVTAIVIVASLIFELELRLRGGIEVIASDIGRLGHVTSPFYKNLFIVHMFFVFVGSAIWAITIYGAVKNFSFKSPRPSMYSGFHKMLAYSSLFFAAGIAVTGLMSYYYAFVA